LRRPATPLTTDSRKLGNRPAVTLAQEADGKSDDRAWHEPDGVSPDNAFFRLEAVLR
jgi:hypothetical protein